MAHGTSGKANPRRWEYLGNNGLHYAKTLIIHVTGSVRYFLCLAHRGEWHDGMRVTLTGGATVSGSGAPIGVPGLNPIYESIPTATVSRGMASPYPG